MSEVQRIALVGLPGTGKSSVAAALAQRLGWRCVDVDGEIEVASGRPAASLLAERGEPAFRAAELEALRRVLAAPGPAVVACGGGLVSQDEARSLLLGNASVVWLDAPDDVLLARLGSGDGRPLLRDAPASALPGLRAARTGAYAAAHLRADAAQPVEATARSIAAALAGAQRVDVPAGPYHVEVRPGAIADLPLHVPASATRIALVADRRLAAAAKVIGARLREGGRKVTRIGLAGDEAIKAWSTAGRLVQRLSRAGLRRGDCVVALGGGALGDLTGFAAATYLRGIAWIVVPTTLLAMVDSAIGGKTGVNLARGKNLAGAVWQPRAVVCDTTLLATLTPRAYRSAFAEIVKYCMISEDGLVPLLERQMEPLRRRDPEAVASVVRRCVAIKGGVVAADEREAGPRAVLNYGHTVGHALEAATGYGTLLHGEAVAAGMRAAGLLSIRAAACPPADIAWQDSMLAGFELGAAPRVDPRRVVSRIAGDKKATAEGVGWVLLAGRGRPVLGRHLSDEAVAEAVAEVLR